MSAAQVSVVLPSKMSDGQVGTRSDAVSWEVPRSCQKILFDSLVTNEVDTNFRYTFGCKASESYL